MKATYCYHVLCNLLSCAGWLYLLLLTVKRFHLNDEPLQFWKQIGWKPFTIGSVSFGGYFALDVIQSAPFLEVLHVAIGLVPPSLLASVVQVDQQLPASRVHSLTPSPCAHRFVLAYGLTRSSLWRLMRISLCAPTSPLFLRMMELNMVFAGTSWLVAGRSLK